MRITLRLILSLAIGIVGVTLVFARYEVRAAKQRMERELTGRGEVLAESISQAIEPQLGQRSGTGLQALRVLVNRFGHRDILAGVAVYGLQGELLAASSALGAKQAASCPAPAIEAMANNRGEGAFLTIDGRSMHVYAVPLHQQDRVAGVLAVFDDAGYIESQSSSIWLGTLLRILIQVVLISLLILLIIRLSLLGPVSRLEKWMKARRAGASLPPPEMPEGLKPIAREFSRLATSLAEARLAAEQEAWLRESAESLWTAERLRARVRSKVSEGKLFVVSNREPYLHVRKEQGVEVVVPASGLVTAMEPVLLACGGTWIAHGSGDSDRENSDAVGRLRVPPDEPQYTLRRVWLTPEEEAGYYYGFANEGLWPLCHIAFARPVFRAGDFEHYRQVNQKFADAVLEEIEGTEDPLVLIQDYHFALLPRMLKKERPDARVSVFWHIPWPNPQVFGICPWEKELLDGLLGADAVGFHIQSHCNNFLETVDDALESRLDWEHFAVFRRGHRTVVRPFPISVSLADEPGDAAPRENPYLARAELFKQLGVEATYLGVGVDRVDYTKGLLERFRGIERFLEKSPKYCGQFTFVQIGAPSRTQIERYANLMVEVEAEAERINAKFQSGRWKPIVFLKRHHTHREIAEYYRAADLCLVTSLHDGMNLVAKEFVASRSDEQGVLILSRFTGASRQLRDALVVNPYDTEELADAIVMALEMHFEERSARMRRMRDSVREQNIYRWAASLIGTLSDIRLDEQTPINRARPGRRSAELPAPAERMALRASTHL
jgi:trehalose-6-phosphate synthase